MRSDGRAPDALRPVSMERHFTKHADGSVLVSFGDTRVICTAIMENRVPPWLRDTGKGWVTAEYAMLPGSGNERIRRDSVNKGRAMEISRLIGRSLRAVVDLEAIGERLVTVDCDVIQADGGTRTAAITGGFVALHDAFEKAVAAGNLAQSPITSHCAAVSVGIVEGNSLLDLCYEEDSSAAVDMNIVMNGDGNFIEVQGCAEGVPFSRTALDGLLALGETGCGALIARQREVLERG